jgi:hypothetical protein
MTNKHAVRVVEFLSFRILLKFLKDASLILS